jgi:hypothetical protein
VLRKPLIRDQRTCLVLGLVLFVLGAKLLHDAYEGRGRSAPLLLRPFTFW